MFFLRLSLSLPLSLTLRLHASASLYPSASHVYGRCSVGGASKRVPGVFIFIIWPPTLLLSLLFIYLLLSLALVALQTQTAPPHGLHSPQPRVYTPANAGTAVTPVFIRHRWWSFHATLEQPPLACNGSTTGDSLYTHRCRLFTPRSVYCVQQG